MLACAAMALLTLLSMLVPLAATPAVALFALEPVRSRAAGVAIDCLFASACDVGELSGDGRYSVADVIAALQIAQADPRDYVRLSVAGDPSISGIFDPSLAFPFDDDAGWMAYSGVDYHQQDGVLVRDVTTRLASSSDGGRTWQLRATINPPTPMTLTVPALELCGQAQCTGRMISEVPFLVDDATDPDTQRRFKLFAHRYFIYPPATDRGEDLQRAFGSINVRTAAAPAGPWSDDVALLGWNLTPPEIPTAIDVNRLGPLMASCIALSEGGALAFADELDLVFTCPYVSNGRLRQRIVLLRSTDHAASVELVATLLEPDDAAIVAAEHFSAPSLVLVDRRPYLLVTPVSNAASGNYNGCVLIAFADRHAGRLERDRAAQIIVRDLFPTDGNRFGGACAWDPRADASGVLMSQLFFDGGTPSFRIYATRASIPPP